MNPEIKQVPTLITTVKHTDVPYKVNVQTVLCISCMNNVCTCMTVADIIHNAKPSIIFDLMPTPQYRWPTTREVNDFLAKLYRGIILLHFSVCPERKLADAIREFMSSTLIENQREQCLEITPEIRKLNGDNDLVVRGMGIGQLDRRNISVDDTIKTYWHGDVVPETDNQMFVTDQVIRIWFDGPMVILEAAQDTCQEKLYPYARYEFPLAKYFTESMRKYLLTCEKHFVVGSEPLKRSFFTDRAVSGEEKAKMIMSKLSAVSISDYNDIITHEAYGNMIKEGVEYSFTVIPDKDHMICVTPVDIREFYTFIGFLKSTLPQLVKVDEKTKSFNVKVSDKWWNSINAPDLQSKTFNYRLKNSVPMYMFDIVKRNKYLQYIHEGQFTVLVDNFDLIIDNSEQIS